MIKILSRYIIRNVLAATVLVAFVMGSVIFVMKLIAEMKNIGDGDYGLLQVLFYVGRRMPTEIYQFSPMIILLGSIVGLSQLATHRELTIMRASGFYIKHIVQSVLAAALMIALVVSFVGELIAPNWNYLAELHKENARNSGQAVVTASGVWMHINDNFIHIKNVIGRDRLEDVTRYQFDHAMHLQSVIYAKSLLKEADGWVMHDALQMTIQPTVITSQQIASQTWDLPINANLLNASITDPAELTFPKLKRFIHFLENNGLQSNEYRYNLWQRVLQPLSALVMVFLAIPFVLYTQRTANMGVRIVIGLLIGFVFFISNALLGQLAIVYQLSPLMAALLPLVLFSLLGIMLLRQVVRT